MLKLITTVFLLLLISGCDLLDEIESLNAIEDEEKVWVFAQFNIQAESEGLESYYYFGEVSKTIYDGISANRIKRGFILLENVKYWGNDDKVYAYEDEENSGEIIFRIKDIRRMKLVNGEPALGYGYEIPKTDTPPESTSEAAAAETSEQSASTLEKEPEGDLIEIIGIVKHINLEGGFFAIEADDGNKYNPIALPTEFKKDGIKVKIVARLKGDIASTRMYGKIIEIVSIESL